MACQEDEPTNFLRFHISMTLLIISIPFMVVAVAVAVLPLVIMSFRAERDRTGEARPWNAHTRVNVAGEPLDQDLHEAA